jgi:hypothetical protein
VVAFVALLALPACAGAAVIGFDDVAAGTLVDDEYAARGVRFGPSPFPDVSGAVTTIAKPQARSGPHVAAFAYDVQTDFSSSWIRFEEPQSRVRLYACRTGPQGDPPPNLNVLAYNAAGDQIDNQQGIPCTLNGALVAATVSVPAITYVNVGGTGTGWALDDLEYGRSPAVVTGAASSVTASGATLGGSVNGDGQATTYRFEYGTTSAYGSLTPVRDAGAQVSADVAGLGGGTVYHYRLVATNATGSARGADATFTTQPGPAAAPPQAAPPAPVLPKPCPRILARAAATLIGTPLGEWLVGTTADDVLGGLAGDDCIEGLSGNDRITGGSGDDDIDGDVGSDRISGEAGDDRIDGDGGSDRISGQAGGDRISGDAGRDDLSGGSGADLVTGDAGDDDLSGGAGDDRLRGGAGDDRLTGGAGRDEIEGGSGGDRMNARDGQRDRIRCGSGRDRVTADRLDSVSRDCERVVRR